MCHSVEPSRATVRRTVAFRKVQIPIAKNKTTHRVALFLAEMEGFEPPHALRRLADFESDVWGDFKRIEVTLITEKCSNSNGFWGFEYASV